MTRPVVPELAVWLTGKREADRLAAHGLELTSDQQHELGRSLVEHAPLTDPAELAPLLAQLQERNRTIRRVLETAPEAGEASPEDFRLGGQRGLDLEHPSSAEREQEQTPVRNAEIAHFLAEARDDDHEWS